MKCFKGEEMIQKHHVIPRHHGGDDSPLVDVTVKEHALLHKQIYDETGCKTCYKSYKTLMGMHNEFMVQSKMYSGEYNEIDWQNHYNKKNNIDDVMEDYSEWNNELYGSEDENMESVIYQESLKKTFEFLLNNRIKDREREVLKMYFGIDRKDSMTLYEIGEEFGLTRDRVRQIKEKAIRRLRAPQNSQIHLRMFLG